MIVPSDITLINGCPAKTKDALIVAVSRDPGSVAVRCVASCYVGDLIGAPVGAYFAKTADRKLTLLRVTPKRRFLAE